MRAESQSKRGLSLVEFVVLATVILLGGSLTVRAVLAGQIFAKRMRAENNLKALGLAMHNYSSANGVFPMSQVASDDPKQRGVGHSGFTAMLPYLEQARIYNAYNFDLEPWDIVNHTATGTRVEVFLAPENKDITANEAKAIKRLDGTPVPGLNTFGPLHYGLNWGGGHKGFGDDFIEAKGTNRGIFLPVADKAGRKAGVKNVGIAQIIDGTSMTLAMVERRESGGWALGGFGGSEFDVNTSPDYAGDDPRSLRAFTGSVFPDGPRALLADGSVRVLKRSLDKALWYALLTRDGAEAIDISKLD